MRFLTIFLIGLGGTSLWASRNGDLREHTQAATSIVMGDVSESKSYYGSDGEIYTDVTVQVSATLKERSRKASGFRTFTVKGGSVGDTRVMFTDVPAFGANESVVVFLEGDQVSEKYSIRDGWVPELGERGSQVLSKIQQHLADQQEAVPESESRRAQDFLKEMATATATDAACFVPIGPKWTGATATYKIGTTVPTTWKAALESSVTSWNRSETAFRFQADAASTNEFLVGPVSGATTLASTRIEYDSTNRMRRFTMTFSNTVSWSPTGEASKFDVQNVTAHELGHALGLNHPSGPTCGEQTMWASAGAGETKKRTLEAGDKAGALSLYPATATTPTPAPTTAPPVEPAATAPVFTTGYLYSAPLAGTPFTIWMVGTGFDPAKVQVVITGPGCATACVVTPRDKSATILSVEMTLSTKGTYTVAIRNGATGRLSAAKSFPVQ